MTIIVYETLARRMILRHRNATGSWFNLRCTVTFLRLFTWALSACCPFTTISRVLPTRSVNLVTVSRGLPIRSCSLWAWYRFFTFERVSRRFNLKLIRSQHAVNSVRVQIEWHSISKWRGPAGCPFYPLSIISRVFKQQRKLMLIRPIGDAYCGINLSNPLWKELLDFLFIVFEMECQTAKF